MSKIGKNKSNDELYDYLDDWENVWGLKTIFYCINNC